MPEPGRSAIPGETPEPGGTPVRGDTPVPGTPESSGPLALRIGDVERTSALDALGDHLTVGRLSLDEFGDRSARVTVARTAADLLALFDDLPEPHPMLPGRTDPAAIATPTRPGTPSPVTGDQRTRMQKLVGAAAAASVIIALALFFLTGSWLWFLLIPGISAVAGGVWGPDWRDPHARGVAGGVDRRRAVRNRRAERRDRRHELGGDAGAG